MPPSMNNTNPAITTSSTHHDGRNDDAPPYSHHDPAISDTTPITVHGPRPPACTSMVNPSTERNRRPSAHQCSGRWEKPTKAPIAHTAPTRPARPIEAV